MVKENGMVMMSEAEYSSMKDKIWKLDCELDIAKMELATYHKSMKELAMRNLLKKPDEKTAVEIPAKDLVSIMESELNDGFDDDEFFSILDSTDITISWNGLSSTLMWGPWIFNDLLPAVKETYDEINE